MSVCIKDNIQNMNLVIGCTVGCSYCYARNNVKRYHMIDDFSKPEFFPNKLRLMEKKRPQNFLLTGMSDLAGWQPEWRDKVFAKIRENPQHQFLFLSKRPDLLDFETDLENAWFGVTVTRKSELWRIDTLKANIRAKHYHVTFVSKDTLPFTCWDNNEPNNTNNVETYAVIKKNGKWNDLYDGKPLLSFVYTFCVLKRIFDGFSVSKKP